MKSSFQQTEVLRDTLWQQYNFPFPLNSSFLGYFSLACLCLHPNHPENIVLQALSGMSFSHGLQNCCVQRSILQQHFPSFFLLACVSLPPFFFLPSKRDKSRDTYRDNSISPVLKCHLFKHNSILLFCSTWCLHYPVLTVLRCCLLVSSLPKMCAFLHALLFLATYSLPRLIHILYLWWISLSWFIKLHIHLFYSMSLLICEHDEYIVLCSAHSICSTIKESRRQDLLCPKAKVSLYAAALPCKYSLS